MKKSRSLQQIRSLRKPLSFLLLTCLLLLMPAAAAMADPAVSTPGTSDAGAAAAGTTPAAQTAPAFSIKAKGSKFYLVNTATQQAVTSAKGVQEYPAGSGHYYYFLSKKGRVKVGMFKKRGNWYYAKADGTLTRGWVKLGKRTYYFKKADFTRLSGMHGIAKKYYFFSPESGAQVKGFVRLKDTASGTSNVYYFNPSRNGARAKGLTKISRRYYYFNAKGIMQTGVVSIKGKLYYFNEKGIRNSGLKTWNGKTYYFTKKLGYTCITGWKKRKGKRYYFSSSAATYGQAVTGWLTLSGKRYYFNANGEMLTGEQTIDGKKYYFDPSTGEMATGEVTVNGRKMSFGSDGAYRDPIETATGPWSIRVNLSTNITTVYRGSTAVRAMYCSPGAATAKYVGTTTIRDKLRWHELMGPSWGQYCEHLYSSILFHSIPYQRAYDPSSMSINGYNQLGQAVSHGCIRLACIDAYYIYVNCPVGTTVNINYYGNTDPMAATYWPSVKPASGGSLGYDPTDPVYSA